MGIRIDLTGIDLGDLIEQEAPATRLGKAYGNGERRTRKGTCPWCGGTDRFAVIESEPPHFYCGIHGGQGCGKRGDAVSFLQQWHNIGFMDACARLGVEPAKDGQPVGVTRRAGKLHLNVDRSPVYDWRLMATYFLERCQQWLWKEAGMEALSELRQRGFADEQIRACGYGYNPKTIFDKDVERWGISDADAKAVWLPRGIVIPWMVAGDLWKLSIRRPADDLAEEEQRLGRKPSKYVSIKGGSNALYRVDTIQAGKPLVIFEGEFNADTLAQVLAENNITDIAAVATGSTGKGRADNWLVKIAKASPILISFDPDGAGASAAKDHWSKVLPQALLWPSVGGDMNDMCLSGKDVVKWLKRGLRLAGSSVIPVSHQSPRQETADPMPCCLCGRDANQTDDLFEYDAAGNLYCPACFVPAPPVVAATQEQFQQSIGTLLQNLPGKWRSLRVSEVFRRDQEAQVKQDVMKRYRCQYEPVTLPLLPRKQCPHEAPNVQKKSITLRGCKGTALAHGWCEEHSLSHDLLVLGARFGYPPVVLGACAIGAGVANWEAYAECASSRRLKSNLVRIKNDVAA